jgi:hypothetical protein
MFVDTIMRFSLACVALALLSGCGGSSAAPQSPLTVSQVLPSSPPVMLKSANHYGEDFVFTAQLNENDLTVYKRIGFTLDKLETIPTNVSEPQGSMATVNGWLYVANGGDANVLVYEAKKSSPTAKPPLEDPGQFPNDVALTPDRNLIAVSNEHSSPSGAGGVSVYLNRQTQPARLLTYGTDGLQGQGVAIDHQGNCYWSFNDPDTDSGSIVKFRGCNEPGSVVVPSIPLAGGLVFDQSGDLYYIDQTTGIYRCKQTSRCALFARNDDYELVDPVSLNFDGKQNALWIADASGYIEAIALQPNQGPCKHHAKKKNKSKGPCYYRTQSVDGSPYGVAPAAQD